MEAPVRPRAMFSTANGKYAYREIRRWVRPIFREDFCFRGDVEQMAQSLQQEFPQECKHLTAADAFRVEIYFDAVDIQMQSRVFLYEVLMRIVVYNFEEARERPQKYVNLVYLDPVRYERLTADDLEIDCFTEAERDLVGYDNTLPAALTILKQRKFPQVFNEATELYRSGPSGPQRPWATDHGLKSAENGGTNASEVLPSAHSQISGPNLPAAMTNNSQPHVYGREDSIQVEYYQKLPNHMSRRASHLSQPNSVTGPPSANTSDSEATILGDQAASGGSPSSSSNQVQPLLLKQASAEPSVRSHGNSMVAGRQNNPGLSRTESKDYPVDIVPHPPIYRGQGINGSRHSKGMQFPGKRVSDDVRQQSIFMDVRPIPPYPRQAQNMPPLALPSQPSLMHRPANVPPVPNQMRLAGSWSVFGPNPNQRSSIEIASRDNLPPFVPYYPRPEYRHAHPGTGETPSQYVTNSKDTFHPRIVTNPSPSTILEDLQGEINSVDQAASLFSVGYRKFGTSQQPAINQQSSRKSSQSSPSSRPNIGPHNYYYPRSDQEQPPVRPREDCILFVSGFPEHLDVKAVWHMLSPVQGLRWIAAPLRTANNEGRQVFTNLTFHDPSFATDALRLLPRTRFAAMNGNVLTVRRFNADRAGLIKHWTTNSSSRSGYPIHRARRSSEPTSSEYSQISFNRNSRPQSRLLTSTTAQYVHDRKCAASNDYDMNFGRPGIPETEKALGQPVQDVETKAVQGSLACHPASDNAITQPGKKHPSKMLISAPKAGPAAASTGSPVKRVKRMDSSTHKPNGKGKPKDHTKALQKQIPNDEATTLELGLKTPADQVIEAPDDRSGPIKLVAQSGIAKSVPERDKTSIEEPETHSTHWSSDDRMQNPIEKMNVSGVQSTDHVSRMKVPLEEAFLYEKRNAQLPLSPTTLTDALNHLEATSSMQTRLTHLPAEIGILQQHRPKDEDVVRQTFSAAMSHARSIDTHEQQLAAEASQRRFVAALVQIQPKVNGSMQTGNGYHSITASKANERQSMAKPQVPERNNNTTPRQNETRVSTFHNRTPQRSLKSSPSSTTKEANSVSRIPKARRSRGNADEVSSRLAIDQPSDGRISNSANTTLSPAPTITSRLPGKYGHTQDQYVSVTLAEAQIAEKCNETSADGPIAEYLENKLETNNTQRNDVLRPVGAESNQHSPRSPLNVLDLPHVQSLSTKEQDVKVDVLATSQDESKELPCVEMRPNADSGLAMTTPLFQSDSKPASDTSDNALDPSFGENKREQNGWTATCPKGLTEETSFPESTTSSDRPGLDVSESSFGSPNRDTRSPLPSRCSPITQSTTVAPIMTRKKKQKKILGTTVASKELEIPYETRVDESEQRSQVDLAPVVPIADKLDKKMSSPSADFNNSINPLQSAQSSVESLDTIKASPKVENEDVGASRSTSTHSPLFVTPPTTPHSEASPVVEESPIAISPSVDNRTEIVKDIPISKSKNRKKNRPGKKKPKCVGKSSVDQGRSVSAPTSAGDGTLSSNPPDNKMYINASSNELLPEQGAHCAPEQSTMDLHECEKKRSHEPVVAPFAEPSLYNNSPCLHEEHANQTLYLHEKNNPSTASWEMVSVSPRTWTSSGDMFPLVQIARDAGYQHAPGSLPFFVPDKHGLAVVGGSMDSALVMELRSRCRHAAIKRIQDLEKLEEQTQKNLYLETAIQSYDESEVNGKMASSVTYIRDKYQDDPEKDDVAPPIYEKMDGLDRAVALEGELQLIIRNAVQMTRPFPTDEHELDNGIFYTYDSTRAKQILKAADFHEISPLTLGHSRDSRWVNEWCDEVAHWLHHAVPRMTEAQKDAMYEWEKANPSMVQNLMELGFSAVEINQCGLSWLCKTQNNGATSTQGRQESYGSEPRRKTGNDKPNSPIPFQRSRNADRESKTGISCAITEINSEADLFDFQPKATEEVKCEPQSVIKAENSNAGKACKPTDKAPSVQADDRHEGELKQPGSNLPMSETSNNEEHQIVETEHSAKPRERTLLLDEKKKDLTFEDEKARLQGDFPGLSFASVDGIITFDSLGSATLKTVSDQVSIAAAIRRTEEDLQGKLSARRYKKVDQTELNTLDLTSSPLVVTTAPPSNLPTSNNTSTSSNIHDTTASPTRTTNSLVQATPNASEVSPQLTPKKDVPTSTPGHIIVQTSSKDLSIPRMLPTTKLSYANALQSPTSKSKARRPDLLSPKLSHTTTPQASAAKSTGHTETDAWSLQGEEAWGSATATASAAVKRSESL